MSATYDAARKLVAANVEKFGVAATLRRITRTYDPAIAATTETFVEAACFVILKPPPGSITATLRAAAGNIMIVEYAVLPALGLPFEPAADDLLMLGDGRKWRLAGVSPVRPDGVAISHYLALGDA